MFGGGVVDDDNDTELILAVKLNAGLVICSNFCRLFTNSYLNVRIHRKEKICISFVEPYL